MPKAIKFDAEETITLKRNQACHQCRKKKRRCDAGRPCGSCTKAHAQTIALHAVRGEAFKVLCTYDEMPEEPSPSSRSTSEKAELIPTPASSSDMFSTDDSQSEIQSPQSTVPSDIFVPDSGFDPTFVKFESTPTFEPLLTPEILPSAYPSSLPPPDMLHHFVNILFACVPFAPRLLHRPSFMASLSEPLNSPTYPSRALLHAICALASFYSPAVHPRPKPDLRFRPPVQLFLDGEDVIMEQGLNQGQAGTFAVEQSGLARITIELDIRTGVKLMDATRASVILSWYYHANAQWVDWWMIASSAIRSAAPLGLNTSGSVEIFRHADFEPVLPFPETLLEQEKRRNLFWLMFINDRHQQVETQWPAMLDELDIAQELPGTLTDFETGNVQDGPRQRLHDSDMLTTHPTHLTDAFTLHLKAVILVSRIGTFNSRRKMRKHSDMNNSTMNRFDVSLPPLLRDPESERVIVESPEFQRLDEQILAFQQSIPREFRDPFERFGKEGSGMAVDPDLYEAFTLPHTAMIMLHDTYANMHTASDKSRDRILHAARAILNSVYALNATSFDPSLLVHYSVAHWVSAARILARFYIRALELGLDDEAESIRQEVESFSFAIGKVGDKLPVGFRAQKMVQNFMSEATKYGNERRKGRDDFRALLTGEVSYFTDDKD